MHIYQSIVVLYVEDGSPVAKLPLHVEGPEPEITAWPVSRQAAKRLPPWISLRESIKSIIHSTLKRWSAPVCLFLDPGKHVFNAHHYACIPERRHHCPVKLKVHFYDIHRSFAHVHRRGGLPDE